MRNILVTRTDRLGDVILSTPVLRYLRETYPAADVTFLVRPQWKSILDYPSSERIRIFDFVPEAWGANPARNFADRIRPFQFDVAFVLHDHPIVTHAVWRAGIPKRVGPKSTLRSFFLFNAGKRQRRSQCQMHEAEYNLDLVAPWTPAQEASDLPKAWLAYDRTDPQQHLKIWLAQANLQLKKYVCFHPGASGSSRYLTHSMKVKLIRDLIYRTKVPLILTGSDAEQSDLIRLAEDSGLSPHRLWISPPANAPMGKNSLANLAELFRNASLVIAHATGPLHLAAAVGTRVQAIYPPLFAQSVRRWGPLVENRSVWIPSVACPEKYTCRGPRCPEFDCLDRFPITEISNEIAEWNQK